MLDDTLRIFPADCLRRLLDFYHQGTKSSLQIFQHIAKFYNGPFCFFSRTFTIREKRSKTTVIVTADIHQGLYQSAIILLLPPSIFDLLALVRCHPLYILLPSSQGAVFLVNSCQGYFRCAPSRLRRERRLSQTKRRLSQKF